MIQFICVWTMLLCDFYIVCEHVCLGERDLIFRFSDACGSLEHAAGLSVKIRKMSFFNNDLLSLNMHANNNGYNTWEKVSRIMSFYANAKNHSFFNDYVNHFFSETRIWFDGLSLSVRKCYCTSATTLIFLHWKHSITSK